MSEADSRNVTVLGEDIPYEVRRSTDATEPRIDVDIRGIRVVLPEGSAEDPESLLAENAAWVIEKKQKYDGYRERIPDREFAVGETFPYLDEPHEIVVERRQKSEIEGGTFRLAEHHVEQTSIKRALETVYRRKAREYFEKRADEFAEEMGVRYNRIEIRNQRTRWGSCSSAGTLGLNWRLMMAPSGVVEYVVVHELAHLREPNHSDAFWSLIRRHCPEYEDRAEWLRENSVSSVFSHDDV